MFIAYHILIKFFNNGVKENDNLKTDYIRYEKNSIEGDLQGIIDKMDYLYDLGVDLIYLGPIFDSDTTHGYDVKDYFNIAPHISVKDEKERLNILNNLVQEAHKRNIKVIIDLILNHSSINYKMDSISKEYKVKERIPKTRQEIKWKNIFKFWDYSDNDTKKFLIDIGKYWLINTKIDGFRLDHVIGINKNFWKDFYNEMRNIKKEVMLLGEVWDDIADEKENYELIVKYKQKNDNKLFTSLMDFHLYQGFKDLLVYNRIDPDHFYNMIIKSNELNDEDFNLTYFIENHDVPRFIDLCKDENKWETAMKILISLTGNLLFEYGNEICIKGDIEYNHFSESGRVAMKFEDNWNTNDKKFYNFTKKCIKIRKENKALQIGKYEKCFSDDKTLIYSKKYYEEEILIIFSKAKNNITLENEYIDLFDNKRIKGEFIFEEGLYMMKKIIHKYDL